MEKDQPPHYAIVPAFNARRRALLGPCPAPADRSECPSLYDYLCGGTPTSALDILNWCSKQPHPLDHLLPAIQEEYPHLLLTLTIPSAQQADLLDYLAQHPDTLFLLQITASELPSADDVIKALRMPNLRAIDLVFGRPPRSGQNNVPREAIDQLIEFGMKNPNTVNHPLDELKIQFQSFGGGSWLKQPDRAVEIFKFLGKTARRISLENFAGLGGINAWLAVISGHAIEYHAVFAVAQTFIESGGRLSCSIDLTNLSPILGLDDLDETVPLFLQFTNGPLIVPANWFTEKLAEEFAHVHDTSTISQLRLVGQLPGTAQEVNSAETWLWRIIGPMHQRAPGLPWVALHMFVRTDLGAIMRQGALQGIINVPVEVVQKLLQYFTRRDLINIRQTSKAGLTLAQLQAAKAFTFNPRRLKLLGNVIPPLSRGECRSLYDYLCGDAPGWAGEILTWCAAPTRNLHHVLPAIQHSYPDLMLEVTMPPATQKHVEQINYIFQHPNPDLRVSLTVHANKLQDGDVKPLLTLLQLGCVKTLVVVATGNAEPPATKAMNAVCNFLAEHPADVHPIEELRMDFGPHERTSDDEIIAADWPMLLLQHFGLTARKVWLKNFDINSKRKKFESQLETKWVTILTSLGAAHELERLTVCGGALESTKFFLGVASAIDKASPCRATSSSKRTRGRTSAGRLPIS
jgi:hypothetical protein